MIPETKQYSSTLHAQFHKYTCSTSKNTLCLYRSVSNRNVYTAILFLNPIRSNVTTSVELLLSKFEIRPTVCQTLKIIYIFRHTYQGLQIYTSKSKTSSTRNII